MRTIKKIIPEKVELTYLTEDGRVFSGTEKKQAVAWEEAKKRAKLRDSITQVLLERPYPDVNLPETLYLCSTQEQLDVLTEQFSGKRESWWTAKYHGKIVPGVWFVIQDSKDDASVTNFISVDYLVESLEGVIENLRKATK